MAIGLEGSIVNRLIDLTSQKEPLLAWRRDKVGGGDCGLPKVFYSVKVGDLEFTLWEGFRNLDVKFREGREVVTVTITPSDGDIPRLLEVVETCLFPEVCCRRLELKELERQRLCRISGILDRAT